MTLGLDTAALPTVKHNHGAPWARAAQGPRKVAVR